MGGRGMGRDCILGGVRGLKVEGSRGGRGRGEDGEGEHGG